MSMDRSSLSAPLIVFTDDPSACQNTSSGWLLFHPNENTLVDALSRNLSPLFIVTNTRRVSPQRAVQLLRENCRTVATAIARIRTTQPNYDPLIANYCDASLTGQFPSETDVIAAELGPFSSLLFIPSHWEAGYITRDSVHYLRIENRLVPAYKTDFSHDPLLGFSTSYLPGYIEEKTKGRIRAHQVTRMLHTDLPSAQLAQLMKLSDNAACVVDCESAQSLAAFMTVVSHAHRDGRRFLFRGSASVIAALAGKLPEYSDPAPNWSALDRYRPGIVVVGSPLAQATAQLERLFDEPGIVGLQIDVNQIDSREGYTGDVVVSAQRALENNNTVVVFTSRPTGFPPDTSRFAMAEKISSFLIDLLQRIDFRPGFLVCKGAATACDILGRGLNLDIEPVYGQVFGGHTLLFCPSDHLFFPSTPVIVCGQNIGGDGVLVELVRHLTSQTAPFIAAKRA